MSAIVDASSSIEEQLTLEPPGGGQILRSFRDAGVLPRILFLPTLLLTVLADRVHWLRISRRNAQREQALVAGSGPAMAGPPPRRSNPST